MKIDNYWSNRLYLTLTLYYLCTMFKRMDNVMYNYALIVNTNIVHNALSCMCISSKHFHDDDDDDLIVYRGRISLFDREDNSPGLAIFAHFTCFKVVHLRFGHHSGVDRG